MKLYVEKVTGYDELEENVFTVEMADCPEVVSVTLASRFHDYNSWQETSKAIAEAIGMITKNTEKRLALDSILDGWTPWFAPFPCDKGPVEGCLVEVVYGNGDKHVTSADSLDWAKQSSYEDTITAYRKVQVTRAPEEKWIQWVATCNAFPPVPDHQFIGVRFGSGKEDTGYPDLWDWSKQKDSRDEIIAYREIDL